MIPIIVTHISSGIEICFKSIAECSNQLHLNSSNISATLKHKNGRLQHKVYTFVKEKA